MPRLGLVSVVLILAASSLRAQGGGPVIYENGSPDMGSAYAGAGARAQDAATAFQNPAGMSRLAKSQLIVGTFAGISNLRLDIDGGKTTSVPPGNSEGGGYQDAVSPGLGSFAVLKMTEDLAFGFSLNALAAAGMDYSPDWVGRTFVTENQLLIANLEPAVSYRPLEWLSLGAGLNAVFGALDEQFKANSDPNSPDIEFDNADDWAFAGTFGILLEPRDGTRIGVTYRTEIDLELEGDLDNPTPLLPEFETDLTLPQGVNLSIYQSLTPRFALLGDVGWSDWSTFDSQPISVGSFSGDINRDWNDTWRVGIGMEFRATDAWLLRSGFSYDSSPVDDDQRLPDLPVGDQFRFSLGFEHDFGEGKVVGLSYTLLYQPMDLDQVQLPPSNAVTVDGEFDRAFIHFVGISLGVTFGEPRLEPSPETTPEASPLSTS